MEKLVKIADEVWIATARLHCRYPDRFDFTVGEIIQQAKSENVTAGELRPGVQVHAYLHCVANKAPNPGRYRMLFETEKGRRRLFKPGDSCHPLRGSGKHVPRAGEIPSAYKDLLHWYHHEYVRDSRLGTTDPILSLRGVGKEMWTDDEADAYVERLRAGW